MSPWKPGPDGKQGHHIEPQHITKKRAIPTPLSGTIVRVTPEDHQEMHRDIKEIGVIGSLAMQDRREIRRNKL